MGVEAIAHAGGAPAERPPGVGGRRSQTTEPLATDFRLRVKELQEAADRMCNSLEARIVDLLQASAEAQRRLAEEMSAWESTRAALAERQEQMSARLTLLEERLAMLTAELAAVREAKGDAERGRDEALQRLLEQTNDRAALEHELEILGAANRGESLPLRLLRLVRIIPETPKRGAPNRREPSRGTQETVPTPVEALKTSSQPYLRPGDHEFLNSVCLRCGIMEVYVTRYGAACRPGEIFVPPGGSKSKRGR